MRDFLRDRKGAIVGRKLADTYGFKVGDTVPLRGTIFPGTWEFVVRGIYDGAEAQDGHVAVLLSLGLSERNDEARPRRGVPIRSAST